MLQPVQNKNTVTAMNKPFNQGVILGEYIKAFPTEKSNDGSLFNRDYLSSYLEASEAKTNKTFQGMLILRRYGISTMLIIIQVSCLWNT